MVLPLPQGQRLTIAPTCIQASFSPTLSAYTTNGFFLAVSKRNAAATSSRRLRPSYRPGRDTRPPASAAASRAGEDEPFPAKCGGLPAKWPSAVTWTSPLGGKRRDS
eukprot:scaffold111705_cov24-Tisochrysis_lutea.AAC.1